MFFLLVIAATSKPAQLRVSSTALPSVAADGSASAPFHSVQAALEYNRKQKRMNSTTIISLDSGLHAGFKLAPVDDGIRILGSASGPPSVITGGIEVRRSLFCFQRF